MTFVRSAQSNDMKSSSSILKRAAIIAVMGIGVLMASDKPQLGKPSSQPAQRQADPNEVEAGRAAARADLEKKLIRYDIVGQPSVIDPELKRLAASKYNISVTFHGCVAGPRVDYVRAYLDVVIAHLKALHGYDPVVKLEKELREKQP